MKISETAKRIPLNEKLNLTLKEAALYTGIGENKLRELSSAEDCEFILWVGNRRMFRRKKLEEYLERQYSV